MTWDWDSLARLWLREPDERALESAHAMGLALPGSSPVELAADFSELFLLNVYPYGSVFTEPSGELNGRFASWAASRYERRRFLTPEFWEAGAPDHVVDAADQQLERIRRDWEERHQGPENAFRPFVLTNAKIEKLSIPPFLEHRRPEIEGPATASIDPVTSPNRSFRKASPLRRWRRLWALTTKIELIS